MRFRHTFFALALAVASFGSGCAVAQSTDQVLASLVRPPGYDIQVYAEVPDVRTLAVAEDLGLVFVGTNGSTLMALAVALGKVNPLDSAMTVMGPNMASGCATPASPTSRPSPITAATMPAVIMGSGPKRTANRPDRKLPSM